MFMEVDAAAKEPLYQQIRNQVVAGIATGELTPGTQLPSVRALAADLGINLHTVNKAYAVLRDEGFIHMRGRAGAVVAHPEDDARKDRSERALREVEEKLFEEALAYRANGGSRGSFLEAAAAQAARAYGVTDPAAQARAVQDGEVAGCGFATSKAAASDGETHGAAQGLLAGEGA